MPSSLPLNKRTAGRRPKADKAEADTRAQILAAARCVFAHRGLDGASVRDVAAEAGVNNAMIYYHFKDKLELYRAVLSDSCAAFDRIFDDPVFSTPATARIKIQKYVEELIRFQHGNNELRRILSMEFASCGQNIKWLADHLFNRSHRELAAILRDGIRNGELQQVDISLAISTLVGMIIHSFITKPVAEYASGRKMDLSPRKFGVFVTELFFNGIAVRSRTANAAAGKAVRS